MAIFFTVLMNFLVRLFGQYAVTVSLKMAYTLTFIALFVSAIAAYITGAGALINGISQTVPEVVNGVWGWVMPDNTNAILVLIGSVYLLRFFTHLYLSILNAKFKTVVSS